MLTHIHTQMFSFVHIIFLAWKKAFHLCLCHGATLLHSLLFLSLSIGDKEWGSRDGAEHSITLLTNMSELDSKDRINKYCSSGRK